jgi:carboxyl-terminal processing protease
MNSFLALRGLRFSVTPILLFALMGFNGTAYADPTAPSSRDHWITLSVAELLEKDHLLRHPLDDEISRRALKTFLKMLDPMKVYFYQSDIDEFTLHENELDDLAKKGDIGLAYTVFERFLKRLDEDVALVDVLLATEHDFTLDEQIVKDRDLLEYPRDEAEARERWRKRVKYELLSHKADKILAEEKKNDGAEENTDEEDEDPIEKISRRYKNLARRWHQTDSDELLELYLTAMTMSFDPHTTYMSPNSHENFLIQMSLKLDGIGAALRTKDGYTVVERIIRGGAADKDGRLKRKDRIQGVGQGIDGKIEDVVEMKLSDVVHLIRGKRGSVVRLEVTSSDDPDGHIIEITRAKIELKDSEAQAEVFEEGEKPDGTPYRIGVIRLPSFYMDMNGRRRNPLNYKSTTRDVRKILARFNRENVDAVVLDLRLNGGGSLQESIDTTGLFIKNGPVVQVKDGENRVTLYRDYDSSIAWDGALLVLISKYSASASEILAGAIQDYGRGLIVGDHATHGKGTVQSLMDLGEAINRGAANPPSLGALKITMQQFYRPSGASTQNRGVLADIELPSLSTHYDVGESDLDYPIDFDEVGPVDYPKFGYVTEGIRALLRQLSDQRRGESEDFQELTRDVELYLEQKNRKYVTLNEEKYLEELRQLNAEKKERESLEKLADTGELGIERNFYLDEALAITVDYLKALPTVGSK